MLSRPSLRRRNENGEIILNLVPILDAMVTLIAFLLYTMSFLALVSIETQFPQASKDINQELIEKKPLQLTLTIRDQEMELWSPFGKVEKKILAFLEPGKPDTEALHAALLEIKKAFPEENQLVLAPASSINYDTLISVMDSARLLENSDPPMFRTNPETGTDEAIQTLFPEIVFGNLLSNESEGSGA